MGSADDDELRAGAHLGRSYSTTERAALTAPPSPEQAPPMPRVVSIAVLLPGVGGAAIGVILGIGISNVHGWYWALAGAVVLAASWLASYAINSTPRSTRIVTRVQPVASRIVRGVLVLWALLLALDGYLLVLVAPYSTAIQSTVLGSPLVVHVAIIALLMGVTYHLLFPIVEPKRRAMLVWRFTQGRFTAKSLFALYFALIISTSIAVWDQLLLLLAKHDVVRFYLAPAKAGVPTGEWVSPRDLISGNHIFSLLMWQLGDMVPTVKVNDTIGFEQPLFYTSFFAGCLVLAFKVIVGTAVIGSVLAIVQARRAEPDKPPEVSLLPGTTQRMLHRRRRASRSGPAAADPEPADP